MSVISFSGLASGLDTGSWVTALTALKNAKIESLQEEKAAVVSLKDAVAGIKTYFTSFRNSLERLTDAKFGTDSLDLFVQNLANSSNPSKVTATATSATARDTYEVGVTQVATATKVNTAVRRTVTVTNTAAETTKLSVLGVKEGFVSINNKEVQITAGDTIGTLVEKLNDNGITSYYEEDKGRFTIATDVFEADDGITDLFDSLGLDLKDVVGEQTKQLMTEGYVAIKPTTLLADIGATDGQLMINQTLVNMNLGAGATVQDFLDYVNNNYGAQGATATMDADGYISITGLDIQEVAGGSNIVTQLGLVEKVDSVTSVTDGLSYIQTESIKLDTKLGEINTTFANYNLVLGTTPTGGATTALNANSTIEDVKNAIENFANANGMSVQFEVDEDGAISITGDIDKLYISGGVATGLGLDVEKVNGTSLTSSQLNYTHTLTAQTSTTWAELGISGASLTYNVLDERGNAIASNQSVGANTTIEAWFNSLKQYGIEGSISEQGVISIDGDGLISGGLATALGLGQVKSGEEVSNTTATSNALAGVITVKPTMTASLGELGITTNQTLTIRNGGTTTPLTFTSTSKVKDIADAIEAAGGTFELHEDGSITIKDIDNLTGSLVTTFGLTGSNTTGTQIYATGVTYSTGSIVTESSKFSDYGITTSGKTYNVYSETGDLIASGVNVGADATVSDFFAQLNGFGLDTQIDASGRLVVTNGYITGDMATALGMSNSAYNTVVTGKTLVSGALSIAITETAALDTKLSELGLNGSYSLTLNYNGTTSGYNFGSGSTLADIKDAVTSAGGKFALTDGYVSFDDVEASGTLLGAFGLNKEAGSVETLTTVQAEITVKTVTVTTSQTATAITTTTAIVTVTSIATTTAVSIQTLVVEATITAISTQTFTVSTSVTVTALATVTAVATVTVVGDDGTTRTTSVTKTTETSVTTTRETSITQTTSVTSVTKTTITRATTKTTSATTTVTGTQTVATTRTVVSTSTDRTEVTYVDANTVTRTGTSTDSFVYRSGKKTVSGYSTTFLASDTKLSQLGVSNGAVTVKDEISGTTKTIMNVTSTSTLSDLLAALEVGGYDAEYADGRVYLNTDEHITLGGVIGPLGFTTSTYSVTYTHNSTSNILDNRATTNLNSTSSLGTITDSAEDRVLNLTIDNETYSHTFAAGNTIADVLTFLASKGVTASMNNGVFQATDAYHNMSIGGTLGDLLLGDNPTTTQTNGVGCYWSGQISEHTYAATINNDTKIVDLGVSTGGLKIYDNGQYIDNAVYIYEDTTIGDLITALRGYDINAGLNAGKLIISSNSDKYLLDEGSNMISKLGLTNRVQAKVDIYEQTNSKNLTVITTFTTDGTTTLKQLGFKEGSSLRIEVDGVMQTLGFAPHETVNDIIDALGTYGIKARINGGVFTAECEDHQFKLSGALSEKLTGDAPTYVTTEKVISYQSPEIKTDVEYFAEESTLLKNLGVTSGYINLYKDGELLTTVGIEENTTVSQFFSALSAYNVISTVDPTTGIIQIQSIGDITIADGTSNLVSHLGLDDNVRVCTYEGTTQVLEAEVYNITEDTLISYFDNGGLKSEGSLYFTLEDQDGNALNTVVNISANETFGSFKEKLEAIGLTVNLKDGKFSYHYGLGNVEITGGSSAATNLLQITDTNLEKWMQNTDAIEVEVEEIRYESIVNYADNSTTLETFGVKAGDFSIGVNGALVNISVSETDSIGTVISKISNASHGSVTASLTSDGRFMLEAGAGVELILGTNTDTTNLATVFGLSQDGSNVVTGEISLYKASTNSKIMSSGLFRLGNVSAGTFIIGEDTFTITNDTTIGSLVAEINRSEGARASAYWDNINGKLVITSIDTGANYLNVQKGTSNITEIFGLTQNDAGVEKLATYNQTLGNNAILTINDTRIVSTSNTITSDVSRIEGLTLNIKDVTPGDYVTIKVERDTQGLIDAVDEALTNYNILIAELNSILSVGGDLNGDTALSAIKTQLTSLFTSRGTNGTTLFRNLAAVGISTEAASSAGLTADIYSLYIDPDKFTKALNESENDVKLLLVGTVDNPGILTKVESLLENVLSTTGYFSTKNSALNREIANYDRKIETAARKSEHYKATLERKFANMEQLYSTMHKSYSQLLAAGIG